MEKTNWRVITGAPCSGKTSVIMELERMGYPVVNEAARAYIDELLATGMNLREIKADVLGFEREILHRKIRTESALPQNQTIFLDRAIPDSIAYFESENLDTREPIEKSRMFRYEKIFLFERLVFEKDPVRAEDSLKAEQLDGLILKSYEMLGYEVIKVPLLSVEERICIVLNDSGHEITRKHTKY